MSDVIRNQVKDLSRRDSFWPGQMPYFIDRAIAGAKDCEASRDIGHVTVGVGKIGIANKVSSASGQCIRKDPLT
jgi:hypothetical protein